MSEKYFDKVYNPDILSCLANLSNDEVFTPPEIANAMLDMLPQEIFSNPDTTFLDPACKTGVFLREIAKRLIKGLAWQFPDLQQRVDHIFHKQLFAISVTELTSLLSRRGVYCSKYPNGEFSVSRFDTPEGNIRYKRIAHTWKDNKCIFCGANQQQYDRADDLETHAYEFIHTLHPEELFNMKFDVIISNPPYQLEDGGNGSSAKPIYQHFVEKAKKLNPKYVIMIIPARWYSGGKGLDEFRNTMINDTRVRVLHDYFDSSICFPGVDISGGVCYFLWDNNYNGKCQVISTRKNYESAQQRYLKQDGAETFIRFNESINIVNKIRRKNEQSFMSIVSSRKPFGLPTKLSLYDQNADGNLFVYAYPQNGYINEKKVLSGFENISTYKVFIAKAYGERGDFPYLVLGKPFIGKPNEICSETYILINAKNQTWATNIISYIKTKFFRFLVLLVKNTQNSPRAVYQFVPMQDFSKPWTDEELYQKYGLEQSEIDFIESMIRPME